MQKNVKKTLEILYDDKETGRKVDFRIFIWNPEILVPLKTAYLEIRSNFIRKTESHFIH